jgi:hypothetical protein
MNELNQVFMNGAISILVALVGLAFSELRKFLQTKIDEIKLKSDAKNYELAKAIATNVVHAVEQIFKDVEGADKFKAASERLTAELNKAGIYVDEATQKVLIESVVNGFNQLKNIEQ